MLNVPSHWRAPPSFNELSPFGAAQYGRPLRIVIDEATAPQGPALELLRAFSERPALEIYSTDSRATRRIELGPVRPERDLIETHHVLPEGGHSCALGAAASWLEHARVASGEYGLDEEGSLRGLLLAQAARMHQLDAVVCAEPVLSTRMWSSHAGQGKVMTPERACALMGLCLRAHNDFTVRVEGATSTFLGFDQVYRGAAAAALPGFFDWLRVAWALLRQQGEREAFTLLRGVEGRLARALVARDYVNVRVRHWRPDETWDEVLYFFESFLLSLAGAVDALARFLHVALGLPGARRNAGFQKLSWRQDLLKRSSHEPRLGGVLAADDSAFVASVEALGALRNFVHGEVLSEELVSGGQVPEFMNYGKGLLVLDGESAERLGAACDRAGSRVAWGIADGLGGAITVKPLVFQRAALSSMVTGLNDIVATNVLGHLSPAPAEPFDPRLWSCAPEYGEELVLLTGFGGALHASAPVRLAGRPSRELGP
jgi:hypothetical protein